MRDVSFDRESLFAFYRAGGDPAAVLREAHRRLEDAADPGVFIDLTPLADVEAEARALPPFDPERFPLWGLPFAVKDNIDVAGRPTTAACPDFAYTPERDAFVVARLRAAGAIPLGKANLDQFATGLVGLRTPYPAPRNALHDDLPPGGSSSGSAVAVARGIATFSLGSDTAGSGRVPAGLNNIVGLKPSLGALSATGTVPACRTLDTISIFALAVADAWAAFEVAAAHDPADAFSKDRPAAGFGAVPPGLRIGIPSPETIRFSGDAAQAVSFAGAVGALRGLGAEIEEVDFTPFFEVAALLYEGAWVAERLSVVQEFRAAHPGALHPVTEAIIGGAERLSAVDAFRGLYRLAELRRAVEPLLAGLDALAVPTAPTWHDLAAFEADPIKPNSDFGTYTNFVNLLDLCGIAVPTGFRADGRPGSVTLLARAGLDGLTASLAAALHEASGATLGATAARAPAAPKAPAQPGLGETALLVVGAHMTGMPLEGQMREHGARPLGPVTTAPAYRLHALPGEPPRPGLLRVASGGAAVAGEVWAMPEAEIGPFLARIPAPLGFGRVTLSDGRVVLGFLAEAAGCAGAEDVTRFGGWRAWIAERSRSGAA
ncbi:MAG: allophanate hydrolase [Pikeienuella sp.]|uniref:allophanate hydrolase n=1 Tax=Pikeienuella sp. TaxID=2831957 RepID=UPI00391DF765